MRGAKHLMVGFAHVDPVHTRWECACGATKDVPHWTFWRVARSWAIHRGACEAWAERRRRTAPTVVFDPPSEEDEPREGDPENWFE